MRILLVSVTAVALTVPQVQAASLLSPFPFFCKFALSTQCAANLTKGNGNKARIDQATNSPGIQIAVQGQDGDRNRAYTGQFGSNQLAATVQKGNDNGSYTYQEGANQAHLTVQNGNGQWGATSSIGNGAVTAISQSN